MWHQARDVVTRIRIAARRHEFWCYNRCRDIQGWVEILRDGWQAELEIP